ncbi:MAG: SMC-Scp complex subunit ScpB [Actinomycetota bacterium]
MTEETELGPGRATPVAAMAAMGIDSDGDGVEMADEEIGVRAAIEAVLLVAEEPVSVSALAGAVEASETEAEGCLRRIAADLAEAGGGWVLRQVGGGWRLYTRPEAGECVERFVRNARHPRLTQAALETLAIVAYRQPVTRQDIAAIRGVNADGVVKTLERWGLVAQVGRDEGPGQAGLYATTAEFLEKLGLDSLKDLPPLADFLPTGEVLEELEAAGAVPELPRQ